MIKSCPRGNIGLLRAISINCSSSRTNNSSSSNSGAWIVSSSLRNFTKINSYKAMLSVQSNRVANVRISEIIKRTRCLQRRKQQLLQSQRRWLSSKEAIADTVEEGIVNTKKHTIRSRVYEQWEKGNILFGISFFVLIYNIDLLLQYKQQQKDREKYGTDFSSSKETYETMNKEILIIRQELLNNYKDIPHLYHALVHTQYQLNGSHGLSNVKANDIIDILEENVGPENHYHLCRSYKLDSDGKTKIVSSVGWYPIAYITPFNSNVQQVEIINGQIQIVPKKHSIWQRLFGRKSSSLPPPPTTTTTTTVAVPTTTTETTSTK